MRVVVTVDVDDRDRYVIAKYFGTERVRATRKQVRQFAAGAVRSTVREQGDALSRRQRAVVQRLAKLATAVPVEPLRDPQEKQLDLLAGGGA